jgi:hypothetical protein
MPTHNLSLSERKKLFLETCTACAGGGGGMSVGDNGFEGSADASGPTAGYDQPLTRVLKKLRNVKRNKSISDTNALGEKDRSSQMDA